MWRVSSKLSARKRPGFSFQTIGSNRGNFPVATCEWIRGLGKVPYIRLMLRSDLEQNHAEKTFSLANILAGKFDDDLKAWARERQGFRIADSDRMGHGAERKMVFLEWKMEWWRKGRAAALRRRLSAHCRSHARRGRGESSMGLARELARSTGSEMEPVRELLSWR